MAESDIGLFELVDEVLDSGTTSVSDRGNESALVNRDPLTGLPTEQTFRSQIDTLLKQSRNEPVAATLALLQLENFYEIRTWVGKSEASLLLSDIARELRKSLPSSVMLCRCEHYEFAALLENECSINARQITDRVSAALQSAVSTAVPPQLELKCGIGLSHIDKQIPSAEVLFARARHSISLAHTRKLPESRASLANPKSALFQIKEALKNNSLQMNFQPVVCIQGDGKQRYEVRSQLPEDVLAVPTDLMFEIATQNALGEVIDRWIISKVLRHLRLRGDQTLEVFVNITLNSLVSPEFLPWLKTRLSQSSISPGQLVIQIGEIDVLIAQHHLQHFSAGLRALGARLSISHFGSTNNSNRYLALLQTDMVKLAPALVENIGCETHKHKQLTTMIEELNSLGIRSIASMVENMADLPPLWRAKVNYVQGYCFQAPDSSMNFNFGSEQNLSLH